MKKELTGYSLKGVPNKAHAAVCQAALCGLMDFVTSCIDGYSEYVVEKETNIKRKLFVGEVLKAMNTDSRNTKADEMATVIHGGLWTTANTLAVYYAIITDDGLGVGDASEVVDLEGFLELVLKHAAKGTRVPYSAVMNRVEDYAKLFKGNSR